MNLAEHINNKLKESRELPNACRWLPLKQQEGIQKYINKGYKFVRVEQVRSAYRRLIKYAILIDMAGNEVCINKNGNNRNMYGY